MASAPMKKTVTTKTVTDTWTRFSNPMGDPKEVVFHDLQNAYFISRIREGRRYYLTKNKRWVLNAKDAERFEHARDARERSQFFGAIGGA